MRLKNKFLLYLFLFCSAFSIFQNIKPIDDNDSGDQEFRDGIIIDNNSGDQVYHIENVTADVGLGLLRIADDFDEDQFDLKYSLTSLGMSIFEIGKANMVFIPLAELEIMNSMEDFGTHSGGFDLHAKRTLERWERCKRDPKGYFKEVLINLAESARKISKVLSPLFTEECVIDLMESGFVEESAKAALIYQHQTEESVAKLKIVLNYIYRLPVKEKEALVYDLIPDSPEDVATFGLCKFFKGVKKLSRLVRKVEPVVEEMKRLSLVEKSITSLGNQSVGGKLEATIVANTDFHLTEILQSQAKGKLFPKKNGLPLVTMEAVKIAEENLKTVTRVISKFVPEVEEKLLFELFKEAKRSSGKACAYQKEVKLKDGLLIFRRDVCEHAHSIIPEYFEPVDHFNIELQKTIIKKGKPKNKPYYKHHIIVDNSLNVIDDFGSYVGKDKRGLISITRNLQVDKNTGKLNELVLAMDNAISPKTNSGIGDLVAADAAGILCRDEGIKDLNVDDNENSEPLIFQAESFDNPEVYNNQNSIIQTNTSGVVIEEKFDQTMTSLDSGYIETEENNIIQTEHFEDPKVDNNKNSNNQDNTTEISTEENNNDAENPIIMAGNDLVGNVTEVDLANTGTQENNVSGIQPNTTDISIEENSEVVVEPNGSDFTGNTSETGSTSAGDQKKEKVSVVNGTKEKVSERLQETTTVKKTEILLEFSPIPGVLSGIQQNVGFEIGIDSKVRMLDAMGDKDFGLGISFKTKKKGSGGLANNPIYEAGLQDRADRDSLTTVDQFRKYLRDYRIYNASVVDNYKYWKHPLFLELIKVDFPESYKETIIYLHRNRKQLEKHLDKHKNVGGFTNKREHKIFGFSYGRGGRADAHAGRDFVDYEYDFIMKTDYPLLYLREKLFEEPTNKCYKFDERGFLEVADGLISRWDSLSGKEQETLDAILSVALEGFKFQQGGEGKQKISKFQRIVTDKALDSLRLEDRDLMQNNPEQWLKNIYDGKSKVSVTHDSFCKVLQKNVVDVLQNQMGELTDREKERLFKVLDKAQESFVLSDGLKKQIQGANDQLRDLDKKTIQLKKEKVEYNNSVQDMHKELKKGRSFSQEIFMHKAEVSLLRARNGELSLSDLEIVHSDTTKQFMTSRSYTHDNQQKLIGCASEVHKIIIRKIVKEVEAGNYDSLTDQQKRKYFFYQEYQEKLRQKKLDPEKAVRCEKMKDKAKGFEKGRQKLKRREKPIVEDNSVSWPVVDHPKPELNSGNEYRRRIVQDVRYHTIRKMQSRKSDKKASDQVLESAAEEFFDGKKDDIYKYEKKEEECVLISPSRSHLKRRTKFIGSGVSEKKEVLVSIESDLEEDKLKLKKGIQEHKIDTGKISKTIEKKQPGKAESNGSGIIVGHGGAIVVTNPVKEENNDTESNEEEEKSEAVKESVVKQVGKIVGQVAWNVGVEALAQTGAVVGERVANRLLSNGDEIVPVDPFRDCRMPFDDGQIYDPIASQIASPFDQCRDPFSSARNPLERIDNSESSLMLDRLSSRRRQPTTSNSEKVSQRPKRKLEGLIFPNRTIEMNSDSTSKREITDNEKAKEKRSRQTGQTSSDSEKVSQRPKRKLEGLIFPNRTIEMNSDSTSKREITDNEKAKEKLSCQTGQTSSDSEKVSQKPKRKLEGLIFPNRTIKMNSDSTSKREITDNEKAEEKRYRQTGHTNSDSEKVSQRPKRKLKDLIFPNADPQKVRTIEMNSDSTSKRKITDDEKAKEKLSCQTGQTSSDSEKVSQRPKRKLKDLIFPNADPQKVRTIEMNSDSTSKREITDDEKAKEKLSCQTGQTSSDSEKVSQRPKRKLKDLIFPNADPQKVRTIEMNSDSTSKREITGDEKAKEKVSRQTGQTGSDSEKVSQRPKRKLKDLIFPNADPQKVRTIEMNSDSTSKRKITDDEKAKEKLSRQPGRTGSELPSEKTEKEN